jgi:hypothetical protein
MSENNRKPSEKLISSIKHWVHLDDKVRKLKEEIKDLNDEKKTHEELVLAELEKMEEQTINISDGKLRRNVTKTQAPLKKEEIQKTIFEFTKDEQKTFDMIEKIMASRQVTEKVNLKRIKNKESVIKKPDKEI